MSAFDKRVLQWLQTSSLTDTDQIDILQNAAHGIHSYRRVMHDVNVPGYNVSTQGISMDYQFLDVIAKTVRRLQEEGVPPPPTTNNNVSGQSFNGFHFGGEADGNETPQADVDGGSETGTEAGELEDVEDRKRFEVNKQKRLSRHAVSAEVITDEDAETYLKSLTPTTKDASVTEIVLKALETHYLFSHLDDRDLQQVVSIMASQSFKRGDRLATAGNPASHFFVLSSGSARVKETNETLLAGTCGGEVALMYAADSDVTIEAQDNGSLCSLERNAYKVICARASKEKRQRYEEFLSNVRFLSGLTPQEKLQLADALKEARYNVGENLITFGEEGKWFSLILEGTVDVMGRDENGNKVHVCSFTVGDCVGELEFLFKHKAVADCVAKTPVRTAKMTARHFEKVIGPAKDVLNRRAGQDDVFQYYREKQKDIDA